MTTMDGAPGKQRQNVHDRPSRRLFVQCLGTTVVLARAAVAQAQPAPFRADHGAVKPPLPVPDLKLTRQDGAATSLFDMVNGHTTAVQLMFTRCTTTCPIQGAIFARVQKLIPDQAPRRIQLISLSVDPENDTPPVLRAWLQRFKSRPGWLAAVPHPGDVERLRDFAGRGRNPSDNHPTQVQLFNHQGQLVWRTAELPAAEEIATALRRL